MTNIGFNLNRNIKPAFGCDNKDCKPCQEAEQKFVISGIPRDTASKFVKIATNDSDPAIHYQKAEKLNNHLADGGNFVDYLRKEKPSVDILA
ncbi:MAG: hypothetical protein WCG23_00655 [bacterium]